MAGILQFLGLATTSATFAWSDDDKGDLKEVDSFINHLKGLSEDERDSLREQTSAMADKLERSLRKYPSFSTYLLGLSRLMELCGLAHYCPPTFYIKGAIFKPPLIHGRDSRPPSVYVVQLERKNVTMKEVAIDVSTPASWEHKARLYAQLAICRHIKHPNLVKVLGVTTQSWLHFGIVSEWMEHGHILSYLKHNPNADRKAFVTQIANAICCLHFHGALHGSISAEHVLINSDHRACVIIKVKAKQMRTLVPPSCDAGGREAVTGTFLRWTAPDRHSLAATIWEIFTGHKPSLDFQTSTMDAMCRDERPMRPTDAPLIDEPICTSLPLWPQDINKIDKLIAKIKTANSNKTKEAKRITEGAIVGLDIRLERTPPEDSSYARILRRLQALCRYTNYLPISSYIKDNFALDGNEPVHSSLLSRVYKVRTAQGHVAVKVLNVRSDNQAAIDKAYCDEVIVWRSMRHPNIAKLLGVSPLNKYSLVSRWMENGTVAQYILSNLNVQRLPLIKGIAAGLQHLHSFHIIHADLKAANVLVNDDGIACLTDFGISSMARGYTSLKYTTVQSFQGTLRWMTPELLCVVAPSSDGSNVDESNVDEDPTVASDWYALAVTMWEIYSGKLPFETILNTFRVIGLVLRGDRPPRPELVEAPQLTNTLWRIIEGAWQQDVIDRINPLPEILSLEE